MRSALMDDNDIQLVISSSGIKHVKAWFELTVCGKYCGDNYKWSYGGLTSLRWIGRVSQRPRANNFCLRCAANYKDVNVNA
jgi:hypothetical protein